MKITGITSDMEVYKGITILYQDNHVIVCIKPAGIPSQGDKTGDTDMLTLLKGYIKDKYNKPGEVYLGLVHRLDRMTEGVMVFARTSKAASRLSENIRQGDFKKKYLAVVNGIMKVGATEVLENYLLKDEKLNMSRVVKSYDKDFNKAKLAKLEYTVLGNTKYNGKEYSYVKVVLYTGRHHQIRVQFANIEHPLFGDVKYGKDVNKIGEDLALYAYSLSFFHPTLDDVMEFEIVPEKKEIWSQQLMTEIISL